MVIVAVMIVFVAEVAATSVSVVVAADGGKDVVEVTVVTETIVLVAEVAVTSVSVAAIVVVEVGVEVVGIVADDDVVVVPVAVAVAVAVRLWVTVEAEMDVEVSVTVLEGKEVAALMVAVVARVVAAAGGARSHLPADAHSAWTPLSPAPAPFRKHSCHLVSVK